MSNLILSYYGQKDLIFETKIKDLVEKYHGEVVSPFKLNGAGFEIEIFTKAEKNLKRDIELYANFCKIQISFGGSYSI